MDKNKTDFYVYVLYREDGITPFYVGKGRGYRWNDHERLAIKGRSYKDNIICKMKEGGISVPKRKMKEGMTNEQACLLERSLIRKIGRFPKGPLANVYPGGEGTGDSFSERLVASWERKKGIAPPRWISEKGSAALRGKPRPPEVRARIAAATKGVPKRNRGDVPLSPEHRAHIGEAHRRNYAQMGGGYAKGYRWVTDGVTDKMIPAQQALSDGWSYGRAFRISVDPVTGRFARAR